MSEASRVTAQMQNAVNKVTRQLLREVHERLYTSTPIDTGWAMSNWLFNIGSPIEEPIGTREDVDTTGLATSAARITIYNIYQNGQAFITNNVYYIEKLNEGYSPQASAGFVEAAIEEGINALDGQVLS